MFDESCTSYHCKAARLATLPMYLLKYSGTELQAALARLDAFPGRDSFSGCWTVDCTCAAATHLRVWYLNACKQQTHGTSFACVLLCVHKCCCSALSWPLQGACFAAGELGKTVGVSTGLLTGMASIGQEGGLLNVPSPLRALPHPPSQREYDYTSSWVQTT